MKVRFWRWLLSLAACVIFPPQIVSAADWITINPLELELLLGFDGWRREYQGVETQQSNWEGGLRFGQDGFILDPGILRFSYYLEPKYVSGTYESPGFREDNSDDYLGYYLTLDWLQGSVLPVRGSFVASSAQQTLTGSLGRRTRTRDEYYRASVEWVGTWLPTDFRYVRREIYSLSTTTGGGRPRLRDREEDSFTISARNRKLSLNLESRRVDDKALTTDNDFDIDRATLIHYFTWGKGSSLRSRYHYYDRRGFNAFTQLNLSEEAEFRHLDNLFSRLEYRYGSAEQTEKTITHYASYRLGHRLYRNLTTTGRLSAFEAKSDSMVESERLVGLDLAYSKADLKGASVSAAFGSSYAYNDRDSSLGVREVIDEPHTVPLSGEVVLNTPFILAESIVVTDATGTRVYVRGVDYEVDALEGNLTRLLVLAGSEIQTGQLILVSYRAIRVPSVEYNRLNTSGSLNIRLGSFSFTYLGNQTKYDVISGLGGGFLTDTRDSTLRLSYFWSTKRTTTQVSAERRVYENGPFKTTSHSLGQSLSFNMSQKAGLNIGLSQSVSESGQEKVKLFLIDMQVDWKPTPSLSVRPTLRAWKRAVSGADSNGRPGEDQIISAGLSVLYSYRLLSADLSYYHNGRTTDGADSTDDFLSINVRRRFR